MLSKNPFMNCLNQHGNIISNALSVLLLCCLLGFPSDAPALMEFQKIYRDGEPMGTVELSDPKSIAVSPDNCFVYVLSGDGVAVFSRDPNSGELFFIQKITNGYFQDGSFTEGLENAYSLVLSNDDRHVYVSGSFISAYSGDAEVIKRIRVTVFRRDNNTGLLAFVQLVKDVYGYKCFSSGCNQEITISQYGKHVYISGAMFSRDVNTGALTFIQTTTDNTRGMERGMEPGSITVSPDNKNIYMAAYDDGSVAVFKHNIDTGALTLIQEVRENGFDFVSSITVSPDNKHVYVTVGGIVRVFKRDTTGEVTGVLTFIQEIYAEDLPIIGAEQITISPDNKYAYVTSSGDDAVAVFKRDTNIGELTFVQKIYAESLVVRGAEQITLSPDNKNVYVTSPDDHAVAVFKRDTGTGELSFIQALKDGDIHMIDMMGRSIAFSPDNKNVYVTNSGDDTMVVFKHDTGTGALTFVHAVKDGDGGVVDGLNGANSVTVSPDNENVYVAAYDAVAVFKRNIGTGALIFIQMIGSNEPRSITVSPDNKNIYVATHGDSTVTVFTRDTGTGVLTFVQAIEVVVRNTKYGDKAPYSVTVSPDNKHVYVYDDAGGTAVFSRNANTGALTFSQNIEEYTVMAFSLDSRFVYAINRKNLLIFNRDIDTGALSLIQSISVEIDFISYGSPSAPSPSRSVAVSPDNKRVYVGGYCDNCSKPYQPNALAVFLRNLDTGELTLYQVIKDSTDSYGLLGSTSVAISPDNENIYVSGADSDGNTMAVFKHINQLPVNTVPIGQFTSKNTVLTFSNTAGNQITVSDEDDFAFPVIVTLTADKGKLSLNGTAGLNFINGDGADDEGMTFAGTLADINTALDGMSFTPILNFHGVGSMEIAMDDQGYGGAGDTTDMDTVAITIMPDTAAPVLEPVGNKIAIFGDTLNFTAEASDPDDNPPNTLDFQLVNAPEGASINSSGKFSWTPVRTGTFLFTAGVIETDGIPMNKGDTEEITIQVLPSIGLQKIPLDQLFTLDLTDGNSYTGVSFTLSSGPGSITPQGLYTWKPAVEGSYKIQITAAETGGASASQTAEIEVVDWVLESTVKAPAYESVNTVQIPILSGGGKYRNTSFSHVEIAVQETASGLYAATANDEQFGTFSANEPAWLRAKDNLEDDRGFSITDKPFAWDLPMTATQSVNFLPGEEYRILARAADSAGHTGTQSEFIFAYKAIQAAVTLSLDASSPSLMYKETEFTLSGKLTRYPLLVGLHLDNLSIVLHITQPDGTILDLKGKTHTNVGQFRFKPAKTDGFTFAFEQEGVYLFVADFPGAAHLEPKQSEFLGVLVGTSAGYAALVQGKIANEEGLGPHYKTASRIYKRLLKRGFEDVNIAFFSDFNVTGRESTANLDNIRDGLFNPQTGLLVKMNGSPAPFYFIMADHGDVTGNFQLGEELLSPEELNGLLDEFEAGLSDDAKLKPRIIIAGACYSGKFIEALSQAPQYDDAGELSNAGRMIITSAAPDEVSYKGPMEPDGIRSGEMFLEEFFQHLARGDDFKTAFEKSVITVERNTRRDDSTNNTGAYRDTALQHPLLDDNGDGRGGNTLYLGSDGDRAANLYLGAIMPVATNYGGTPAEILNVTDTIFLDPGENRADLRITVNNAMRVNSAPVDIRVPQTKLQQVVQAVTEQQEIDEFKRIGDDMDCTQAVLPHECTLSFELGALFEAGENPVPGTYEIFHFVRDAVTYEISPLRRSLLYKNYEGNQAPGDFKLLFPENGAKPQTVLITDWERSVDPDGDALTYTLSVAGDADFTDMVYQTEELIVSMAVIAADAGLEDRKTYYWKATAIDKYGARTESPVFSFTTDNINASPSLLTIRTPTDAFTHGAPPSISVTPSDGVLIYSEKETHNVLLPQQEKLYKILVEAPDHKPAEVPVDARNGTAIVVDVALPPLVVQPVLSVTTHGEGTVSSIPAGIYCGSDCTEEYADTTMQVALTANPAPHHQFAYWTGGGCAGNDPVCSLTMSEFRSTGAVFERSQYLLAVRKPDGAESDGYISGPDIDCGADCEERYPAETGVSLTAQPADPAKYRFAGWVFESSQEQHCMDGNQELSCRFTVLQNETLTANFERLPDMALTLSAPPSQLAPGENVRLSVELDTKDPGIDDAEIELRFPRTLLEYTNWEDSFGKFQALSSPAENTGCVLEQGCLNLRLNSSLPTSDVFTVSLDFIARESGTAEVCFTANNRFLLKGNAVSHRTSGQGCVSMTIICPALAAAAIDAEQKDMNTQAAFNACMTVNEPGAAGAQSLTFAEIASHQEVQISGTISADPAHAGQRGDILLVDVYNTPLDNPELEIFALDDEENSVLWDGEIFNLATFQPAAPLGEKFRFLLKRTPINTGLWRIFLGYRLAGGEIIFTAEPLTITVNESL